jgi:hypothetical protein
MFWRTLEKSDAWRSGGPSEIGFEKPRYATVPAGEVARTHNLRARGKYSSPAWREA